MPAHANIDPVVPAGETFSGTWPYAANYSRAPGFSMHYVDEGSGEDTLLVLHGEPTWGYLFRHQIAHWATRARVVVPDHMGFGKSAAPAARTYWLQDHVDNLEALVLALDLTRITLVMHDFGGPVGMGLAIRHPNRVKQFVAVNGPMPLGQPDLLHTLSANASGAPWFQWIVSAHKKGTLLQTLGNLDYNMLSTLKLNGFERNEIITPSWLRAYTAPFPSPSYTQGPTGWALGFATGQHEFAVPPADVKQQLVEKPAIAIWGARDQTLQHRYFIPLFRQLFPHAPVHILPQAGHYSTEDAPEAVTALVLKFLQDR